MKLFKLTWSASSFGFEEHEWVGELESEQIAVDYAYQCACEEFTTEYIGSVDDCPTYEDAMDDDPDLTEDDWIEATDEIMNENVVFSAVELTETEGWIHTIRNL